MEHITKLAFLTLLQSFPLFVRVKDLPAAEEKL
jgi:hypothetical protein